jgi:2'-5' RNA ligase
VQKQLYTAVAPLRRADLPLRWTRPEALHLTLKFLGETAPEALDDITRVISEAAALTAPFTLRLHGTGAFPSLARPRVLWIGADPAPELLRLQAEMGHALEPLGFAPEPGPFRPHLTLGRVRRGAERSAELRRLPELLSGVRFEAALPVPSLELMRSHLAPEGSRYEVVQAFPLG